LQLMTDKELQKELGAIFRAKARGAHKELSK
jgi:hypothetical protein